MITNVDDQQLSWSNSLVSHYFVDLTQLCEAISSAIPIHLPQIMPAQIEHLIKTKLPPQALTQWIQLAEGRTYVGVPLFIRRYEAVTSELGLFLGVKTSSGDIGDEWADESLPGLREILWGLSDRLREDLAGAKQVRDPGSVWASHRVTQAGVLNGECQQQVATRVARLHSCLTLVR